MSWLILFLLRTSDSWKWKCFYPILEKIDAENFHHKEIGKRSQMLILDPKLCKIMWKHMLTKRYMKLNTANKKKLLSLRLFRISTSVLLGRVCVELWSCFSLHSGSRKKVKILHLFMLSKTRTLVLISYPHLDSCHASPLEDLRIVTENIERLSRWKWKSFYSILENVNVENSQLKKIGKTSLMVMLKRKLCKIMRKQMVTKRYMKFNTADKKKSSYGAVSAFTQVSV